MPTPTRLLPARGVRSNHAGLAGAKWERQADEAASRMLAGERDLVRYLTPAPAASLRIPLSRGEALDPRLRADLEAGFGADLTRLRIHRDAPAAEAVRGERARAFASGAHLYFAPATYDPESVAGRALIAHETAHALQQTGRGNARGRIAVTEITGAGAIQLDVDLDELLAPYRSRAAELSTEPETEPATGVAPAAGLERLIRQLSEIAGARGRLTREQGASERVNALVRAFGDAESDGLLTRSLLFDALKIWHLYEPAARLIERDIDLVTRVHPDEEFLAHLRDSDEHLVQSLRGRLRTSPPDPQVVWLFDLRGELLRFLTRPAHPLSEVTRGFPESEAAVWDAYRDGATGLVPNERLLLLREAMWQADLLRFSCLRGALGVVCDQPALQGRLMVAQALADVWSRSDGEEGAILAWVRESLRQIAVRSQQQLQGRIDARVADLRRRRVALGETLVSSLTGRMLRLRLGRGVSLPPEAPELEFPTDPLLSGLVDDVEGAARSLFYEGSGDGSPRLLSAESYSAAVERARRALAERLAHLEAGVDGDFLLEWQVDERLRDRAVWLDWAIEWLRELLAVLARPNLGPGTRGEDLRLDQRLRLAVSLELLGVGARRPFLVETAEAVLAGTDLGHGYIVLTGDWRNSHAPLGRLREDAPQVGPWGITSAQLVNLFVLIYGQRLAQRLREAFPPDGNGTGGASGQRRDAAAITADYQAASARARVDAPPPVRYEPTEYLINYLPGDQTSLRDILQGNRRFDELVEAHADGDYDRVLVPLGRPGRLFVWVLPELTPLYERLRRIDFLASLVGERVREPGPWLRALGEALEGDPARARELRRRLSARLDQDLDVVLTRAHAWRRRHITEMLRSALVVAAETRGDPAHYSDMFRVLQRVREYALSIRPADRVPAQMTAMLLDLAPELHAALVDEPGWVGRRLGFETRVDTRYDVVIGWSDLIDDALAFLARDDSRQRLGQVLVVRPPRGGDWTDSDRLRRLREARLLGRRQQLTEIQGRFSSAVERIRRQGPGFEARRGRGLRSMLHGSELPLGTEMYYQGRVYRVHQLHAEFEYFPPYAPTEGRETDSLLTLLSGATRTEADRSAETPLLSYTVDGEEQEVRVHRDDDRHLAVLASAIEAAAFAESMENLGQLLEEAAELGMDLVELVPGFGQAFTAARLVAEMTRFALEDMPGLLEAMDDPWSRIEALRQWFAEEGWLDQVVEFLFLGNATLPLQGLVDASGEDTHHARRRRHGGMDRLIRVVRTLGTRMAFYFARLRGSARAGVATAQQRLIAHRVLMRILELLPGLLSTAETMVALAGELAAPLLDDEGRPVPLTPRQLLDALIRAARDALQGQIQETFGPIAAGLNGLEVPEAIVPEGALEDVLLSYALSRFGSRGRLINRFLETSGLRHDLAVEISRHLVHGTDADVNLWWLNRFRGPLQERLVDIQRYLIDQGLNVLIRNYLGAGYQIDLDSIGSPTITAGSAGAETEAMPRPGRLWARGGVHPAAVSGGRPLAGDQRRDLERHFGHDFSHVRVHRGPDAERLTRNADAYALTSGSHVFLSEGLDPRAPGGRRVLDHELAHVLQQTGPRPLGRRWDRSPRAGRPGLGLRFDPRREAAADRMADRARATGTTGAPVPVEAPGEVGLEPTPTRFALRLMDHLTVPQRPEEMAAELERIPHISGDERRSFLRAQDRARDLWGELNSRLESTAGRVRFDRPFNRGRSLIVRALGTVYRNKGRDLEVLTYRSARQLPSGDYRLRPRRFLNELARYIYARSGISLTLRPARGRLGLVRVTYIHLPYTPPGSDIWIDGTHGVKASSERAAGSGASVLRSNWARIRERIASLQYGAARVWDRTEFRLSDTLIGEFVRDLAPPPADEQVSLGSWADYTNPTNLGADTVGMRVATHGQLTAHVSRERVPVPTGAALTRMRQRVREHDQDYLRFDLTRNISEQAKRGRRSHHIPQYLLVQYFRNQATTPLFGSNEERLPGLSPTGSETIDEFRDQSGHRVQLDRLDPGRGSNRALNLPAVSLAARTHERGRLHVNQASEWSTRLEDRGNRSQSAWIDYFFWTRLESQIGAGGIPLATTGGSRKTRLVGAIESQPQEGTRRVYLAMAETYHEMYDRMMDALGPALERYELPYYADLALANDPDASDVADLDQAHRPRASGFAPVVRAVRALNERIMWQWRP